jgi:sec-independent protein translocase protein TatC
MSHLIELRDRLLRVVFAIGLSFLALVPFAKEIYHFVAEPMLRQLPAGSSMIATEVTSPFLTPFKLTLMAAIFLVMPFILYQIWAFVAPGLYKHERRLVYPLLASSIVLFYSGMAFAYYVVFPVAFPFLTGMTPEGVQVSPDIRQYLDFVLGMFFAFGVAFEVPVATVLVVWSGLVSVEKLRASRRYVIVGAFFVAAVLTPPDVTSQIMLAIPMCLLFELGLLVARFYVKPTPPEPPEPGNSIAPVAAASDAAPSDEPAHYYEHEKQAHAEYEPLTPAEMDAELDRIAAEEAAERAAEAARKPNPDAPADEKT